MRSLAGFCALAVLGVVAGLVMHGEAERAGVDRSQMLAGYRGPAVEFRPPVSGHPWTPDEVRFEAPIGSTATCDEIVGVGEWTVVRVTLVTPRPEGERSKEAVITAGVNSIACMQLHYAHPHLAVEVRVCVADASDVAPAYQRAIEVR